MVLTKSEISKRCQDHKLLENYKEENIQTCSYDLRLGNQYYYEAGDSVINDIYKKVDIKTLDDDGILTIPPHAICYVITEEIVNMPNNLTASISLSFGLINKGVMLAAQPPYDPGYSGKTVALLHNLSDAPIKIKRGAHILNMVFSELSGNVEKEDLYKGNYQKLDTLEKYCKERRVGAVYKLNQEFIQTSEKFTRAIPNMLTVLTGLIGLVTIVFTVLIAIVSYNNKSPKHYVNEEQGTLSIDINGKLYDLGLKETIDSSDNNTQTAPEVDINVNEEKNVLVISIDGKQYEVEINSTEDVIYDKQQDAVPGSTKGSAEGE